LYGNRALDVDGGATGGVLLHFQLKEKAISCLLLACAICFLAAGPLRSQSFAEDWPKYNRDLGNTAHSAETGISSKNIKSLKTKWTFQTGGLISATPAVATINGTSMVFIPAWNGVVYALNAITGQAVWSFTVDFVGGRCSQAQQWCRMGSSPAVDTSSNMVFVGSYNAYLYALDATTGKLVWKQSVGDSQAGYEVWTSPSIYQGVVYIGASSHGDNPCIPGGEVLAYDEASGALEWSFNTIDQSTCPQGTCVGGSVWASVAIDDMNGIVYAGTANPGASCMPPSMNAGLHPDSVLALNAKTGKLLNYFQALKNDTRDQDFGASPVLHMTGETNQCTGVNTTEYWVTEPSKDNFVYTLQRDANGLTGKVQKNDIGGDGTTTPAVRPSQSESSCDNEGHKIIDYRNTIYVSGAKAFFAYAQNKVGHLTQENKDPFTKQLRSVPAVIQDVVLFGGSNGALNIAGESGEILRTIPIGSPIYGGVAISNGRVYLGATSGTVYCMSINGQ